MKNTTTKELTLDLLKGDIYECTKSGMTKKGIRGLLKTRFMDKGLSAEEFETILDTVYDSFWKRISNFIKREAIKMQFESEQSKAVNGWIL